MAKPDPDPEKNQKQNPAVACYQDEKPNALKPGSRHFTIALSVTVKSNPEKPKRFVLVKNYSPFQ